MTRKSGRNDPPFDAEAILITGGSGFVGRSLVSKLAAKEETVVCMYHHRLPEPQAHVYPVCSDMGSAELIAAPLRGVHTVVHLAWESNFVGTGENVNWSLKQDELPKNVRLLRNLIAAMEKAGTQRIVFLSAVGASRFSSANFLKEKYLAEFFILNSKIPEKIIVRSSMIYGDGGPNDKFLRSIIRVMQFPGFYPVPHAKQRISPVHIDDITTTLSEVATLPMSQTVAVVEVAGQESYPVEEVFKLVSDRYVRKAKIPLRGFLGDSLLPFFERDKKQAPSAAKIKHFLSLATAVDETTAKENPLQKALPKVFQNLRESLAQV